MHKIGDRCIFTNLSGSGARTGEECTMVKVVTLTGADPVYHVRFDDGHTMNVRAEELGPSETVVTVGIH